MAHPDATAVKAPCLDTERLRLRPYRLEDFDAFARFYASERSRYADGPASREQAWAWFASGAGRWGLVGYGSWAIERRADAEVLGVVSLNHPVTDEQERELGWLLWEGCEGYGYATEAAVRAKHYAFGTLGWAALVSYVAEENTRSQALAMRLGGTLDEAATSCIEAGTLVYRYSPQCSG